MPTAAEIAERIRAADEERITKRAEKAGRVVELAEQADTARARLDELTAELGSAVAAATEVLSLDELAGFTERSSSEVNEWARTGKVSEDRLIRPGRRRGQGKQSTGRARRSHHKTAESTSGSAGANASDGENSSGGSTAPGDSPAGDHTPAGGPAPAVPDAGHTVPPAASEQPSPVG
jgi:hypothetical protein